MLFTLMLPAKEASFKTCKKDQILPQNPQWLLFTVKIKLNIFKL